MASVEPRGNGTWRIQVCCGYDEKGQKKRIRRTIKVDPSKSESAQRKEAMRIAAALETDYSRHVVTDSKRISVAALCDEYLEYCKRKKLANATIAGYKALLERRIIPYMGNEAVQDVTPRMVTSFFVGLTKEDARGKRSVTGKLSGTSQLHYHRVMHSLFEYAMRMQYIAVNPVDLVEPPRMDTPETRFYELEDCAKLLNVLDGLPDEQWRLFYYLAIYTGMRPGEIVGLDWTDIDFENHTLTVRAGSTYVKGKGMVRTDRPKTQKSIRMIDLPPNIVNMLMIHKAKQEEYKAQFADAWPEPNAVFTGDLGKRLGSCTPTKKFKEIITENNLPPITLYGLRHTAATIMIAQGLNARDVAARLGHSQTSTTLNVYAHAFADANTRATAAVVAALEKARNKDPG